MKDKQRELQEIAESMQQLPDKHVAFHILQQSLSFSRVQYWARTTPRAFTASFLELHSNLQKDDLETLLEQPLSPGQWLQARLSIKSGG